MKMMRSILIQAFAVFILIVGMGQARAEQPSAELLAKGRELFNSKKGLNTKYECILCHKQQEKVIKKAKIENLGDKFPAVINKYLTTKSKGPALKPDSPEMKALMAYILYEHSK